MVKETYCQTEDVGPLDQKLCFSLYATSRLMTRIYEPLLKTIDITYPQFLVMLCLWGERVCTVERLGFSLYLDSGTLTPLLKRLEAKKLIRRVRDKADERRVLVSLTDLGEDMKKYAPEIMKKISNRVGLNPDDLGSLIAVLEKCRTQLTGKDRK